MRSILIQIVAGWAVSTASWAQPAATWPEKPVPGTTEEVAIFNDKRIKESSGLCRSGRHAGIFWTMNDSGGEPCIFAIDQKGGTRAKVRVRDAANFDWEDLASGTDADGTRVLFVGDIGDNFHMRASIQVYEIPEPDIIEAGKPVDETSSSVPKIWRANYPDGKHNAESLLVHPLTRRIHILTKSDDGKCALYAFPEKLETDKSMTLIKIIDLQFPAVVRAGKRPHDNCMTTSACFSPDGSRLVVSTYSSLYEWALPEGMLLEKAMMAPPVRIEPRLYPQVEGVCYDADGVTLWFTSERLPTPLVRVKR
jgi:hypothetical protein